MGASAIFAQRQISYFEFSENLCKIPRLELIATKETIDSQLLLRGFAEVSTSPIFQYIF